MEIPDLPPPSTVTGSDPSDSPYSSATFLGVSVRSHASGFGNVELTDRLDGAASTAADEEFVDSLAATAGIAIENIRLDEGDEKGLRLQWPISIG